MASTTAAGADRLAVSVFTVEVRLGLILFKVAAAFKGDGFLGPGAGS